MTRRTLFQRLIVAAGGTVLARTAFLGPAVAVARDSDWHSLPASIESGAVHFERVSPDSHQATFINGPLGCNKVTLCEWDENHVMQWDNWRWRLLPKGEWDKSQVVATFRQPITFTRDSEVFTRVFRLFP